MSLYASAAVVVCRFPGIPSDAELQQDDATVKVVVRVTTRGGGGAGGTVVGGGGEGKTPGSTGQGAGDRPNFLGQTANTETITKGTGCGRWRFDWIQVQFKQEWPRGLRNALVVRCPFVGKAPSSWYGGRPFCVFGMSHFLVPPM